MTDPSSPSHDTSPPAGTGEVFVAPTSFLQRRLFIIDRIFPGLATYNVPVALAVSGPLDVGRLTEALAELTVRHETLRTSFADGDDREPVQLIAEELAPVMITIDLTGKPAGEREAESARILAARAATPFDLTRAPLFHTVVVRLAEDRFDLLFNLHHGVIDAWSVEVLVSDLFEIYAARGEGREPELPELAIQYADFASWQRDWLVGEALEQRLAPWRRRLSDAPVTLALPLDRPRSSHGTGAGGLLPLVLPTQTAHPLRELARAGGATLFMATLAAYAAFLSRISGQRDLIIGSPVTGRNRPELEAIIGCFVNTLPLRCQLTGETGFTGLLAAVRAVVVEAFANQDLPFEKMVEEVRPERRLDVNPLFQAALAYQQPPVAEHRLAGLTLRPLGLHSGTSKVDLSLHLSEDGDGMSGFWEWSTDLFDRTTVARFATAFERLVAAAVTRPEEPISRLPLLSPAEAHQLLAEWNDSAALYPAASTLPELFAAIVATAPEAPALVTPRRTFTYREIDEGSDRIADRLLALGLAAEARVGVLLERGPEMLAGFLGILKAGGAYLPLDPAYPAERLALLADDAAVAAFITRADLAGRLPAGRPVLMADGPDAAVGAAAGGTAMRPAILPDQLAYVLYTSGSTGRPKGVEVTHRAVIRLVRGTNYIALRPADRVAWQTPAGFDVSTFEIWGALLSGSCLVLLDHEITLAPDILSRTLAAERIDVLALTPALFNWVVSVEPAAFRPVRDLLVGGDALDPTHVATALAAGAPRRLVNVYGPTEATTYASFQEISAVPTGASSLPIGRPLANARLHVLDDALQPVPIGVVGELFLGGDGLARGYRGDPVKTAESFVPDPFSSSSGCGGERLYRSGDLARVSPGGAIDCLGRIDHQVKIRGMRIEPAEVEAALASHPAVASCAVAARRDSSGNLALYGYYVARPGTSPTARKLREHLLAKLPEPMVPAAFVALAALPHTASGKLDRAALPEPEGQTEALLPLPPSPVAELVMGIWAEALRIEEIGLDDNFFDLGGHSLTATMVTAQVRSTFGVQLAARVLFEAPILSEFAARVEKLLADAPGADLPAVTPLPRDGEIPLSYAQERFWFVDQMAGGKTPYYILAADTPLHGRLNRRALARALAEVERRQEALRTTFRIGSQRTPIQVIHPPAPRPLATVDLAGLTEAAAEREVRRLIQTEGVRPFSLDRGPLARNLLLRLAEERHSVLLFIHHIVADGWSLAIYIHELLTLYHAFAAGRPSPLPRLAVQSADFAIWQRRWLDGTALAPHVAFWHRELEGAPLVSNLPVDRPRPPLETFAGRSIALALSPGEMAALAEFARSHRATLFMVILTGWSALLARTTGQTDLVIGTPVANRSRAETASLIGCFVNLLAMRLRLGGEPGWSELLDRAREAALGAYSHQDLPFERLVEELRPERDLSRHPLFQVSCSVENQGGFGLDQADMSLGLVDFGSPTELFDLSLKISESARGAEARLSYKFDLFDPATADRLAKQLERLLSTLPFTTDLPFSEVPLLAPEEEEELLFRAGAAASDKGAPAFQSAAVAFASWAERQPLSPALAGEGWEITYEELDRRSNRLARWLAASGVGPGRAAALLLDDPVDLATGTLAAAKCGGAFLPLDPRLVDDRLATAFAACGAAALVTGVRTTGRLLSAASAHRLDLRSDLQELGRAGAAPLAVAVEPESLAVIAWHEAVESGVEIRAAALAARCRRAQARLGFAAGERFVVQPASAVDAALALLAALTVGATWTVGSQGAALSRQPLPEGDLAVDAGGLADSPGALLLDALGIPVPVRAIGRLWLGGATLAQGYHRSADRTADAFRPDPAATAAGARRFDTGLLARERNDGRLEVFGLPSPDPSGSSGGSDRTDWVPAELLPPPPAEESPDPEALDAIEQTLAGIWHELLDAPDLAYDDNFFELGGHSMLLAIERVRLQEIYGLELTMLEMFGAPTLRSLALLIYRRQAAALAAQATPLAAAAEPEPEIPVDPELLPWAGPREWTGREIAIVGMAGRFPGADDTAGLWRNLAAGIESITFSTPEGTGWQPPAGKPLYRVPAAGMIAGAEEWDAAFFGASPREAAMDPQQRLFLECSWQALEDAGYDPGRFTGTIGVWGGASKQDYLLVVAASGGLDNPDDSRLAHQGNERDFLTARVSYKLELEGPSVNVQTACSTALSAVHLAGQSLLAGECDLALAGGVSVSSIHRDGYLYQSGAILSADGHCRPFDAQGTGSVDSEGVGIVVLKRLDRALADGDSIRAVVRASGINNDGGKKAGFAAPRVDSQARLMGAVLARSGVPAGTITLVEAHGTGTPLGDSIEFAALTQALRGGTERSGVAALGSIKGNIGHTNRASGIAGLIKAVLALEHRQLPPTLHFTRPHPEIDLAASPFFVNTELTPWRAATVPRRALVNSFGVGGANACVVLEEAPLPAASELETAGEMDPWQLLLLSAKSEAALTAATARLAAHLRRHPELPLADVAWTLQVGRHNFAHRRIVLARDAADAADALAELPPGRTADGVVKRRLSPVEPPVEAPTLENLSEPARRLLTLGRQWLAGVDVDWEKAAGPGRRRLPLPTYPFERQRYWVEAKLGMFPLPDGSAEIPNPDAPATTEFAISEIV